MFKSKKESICIRCNEGIKIGDAINWSRSTGQAWHYGCAYKSETVPALSNGHSNGVAVTDRAVLLENALSQFLKTENPAIDESKINELIDAKIKDFKPSVKTIEIRVGELPKVEIGLAHKLTEKLTKMSVMTNADGNHANIYIHGPAGSGKSTAAKLVSKSLSLEYGYISVNPQTPESRLIGFMNANGNYVETEFFKRYTTGGVFCLDEVDNAASNLITTLNSLLENGHGSFPHGVFERHKDFIFIATGNTIGRGGNIRYPERRALDSAFLDRFFFLDWCYDNELTDAIVNGILGDGAISYMNNVKDFSETIQAKYPTLVIGPRSFIQGAVMVRNGFTLDEVKSSVFARGLSW